MKRTGVGPKSGTKIKIHLELDEEKKARMAAEEQSHAAENERLKAQLVEVKTALAEERVRIAAIVAEFSVWSKGIVKTVQSLQATAAQIAEEPLMNKQNWGILKDNVTKKDQATPAKPAFPSGTLIRDCGF